MNANPLEIPLGLSLIVLMFGAGLLFVSMAVVNILDAIRRFRK